MTACVAGLLAPGCVVRPAAGRAARSVACAARASAPVRVAPAKRTTGAVVRQGSLRASAPLVVRGKRAARVACASAAHASAAAHDDAKKGGLDVYGALDAGLGSVILLAATLLSLVLANSSASAAWVGVWETHVGPAALGLHLSLREWVNEGLMAIFFFVVGVDIKKEFVYGSLASVRKAVLPCLGALGGMVLPMLVYTVCNLGARAGASAAGWAVPMATDIAFAMGVFGFFKSRMPPGAQAFLLTLATVDDLGAIAVIAIFFAGHIALPYLTAAVAVCAGLAALSRRGRDADLPMYALAGVALWYCLLRGGINADIAGVVTAMALPAPPLPAAGGDAPETLLDRLHHMLSPWTALLVMPVFALANTAVPLSAASFATLLSAPVAQGIGLGLFLGKPLGIVLFSMIGIKLGLASWPTGMGLKHLLVVGVLGGIGFTMSLFLIQCSFVGLPQLAATAKLAVLLGSLAAAAAGAGLLALFPVAAAPAATLPPAAQEASPVVVPA